MVFIGNIQAAGVGITLVSGRVLIFNNFEYTHALNSQMEDRIYRFGQKRDVYIYYQYFKNTEYERIRELVLNKKIVSDIVIKKETEK
jgi:SNF2 family DNA or RNA helicase